MFAAGMSRFFFTHYYYYLARRLLSILYDRRGKPIILFSIYVYMNSYIYYYYYYYYYIRTRWSLSRTTRMKVVVRARNQFSTCVRRALVNGPKRRIGRPARDIGRGRRTHGQLCRLVRTRRMCGCR